MSVSADTLRSPEEWRSPSRKRDIDSGMAADRLTNDLLVEILSRVPAKSLCRFKCVSNHWLGLIDHPDHRKKLPQTLAGFLCTSTTSTDWAMGREARAYFTSVSGRRHDTSFAYLSKHRPRFGALHGCNGLLIASWYDASSNEGDEFKYVVFNPATQKWVALLDSGHSEFIGPRRLCFDPASSSHFHVFQLVKEQDFEWLLDERDKPELTGVVVYSSETGGWVYKEKTWNQHIGLTNRPETVFLNGYLHFLADCCEVSDCLAVVDTKGETWMNFPVPSGLITGFIQRSQDHLNYANFQRDQDGVSLRLVLFVLDNYQSRNWILTHIVKTSYTFGGIDVRLDEDFYWMAIHPDCNLICFTAGCDNTLMCYNMYRRQAKVISNLDVGRQQYLPYVPLYAEIPSLHI